MKAIIRYGSKARVIEAGFISQGTDHHIEAGVTEVRLTIGQTGKGEVELVLATYELERTLSSWAASDDPAVRQRVHRALAKALVNSL